jgi:hypothetical protein
MVLNLSEENNYMIKLCKDCFHCKIVKNSKHVKCSLHYFYQISINNMSLYTPTDFECLEWDNGD